MKRRVAVAVDFDGTVVREHWPKIGPLKFGAKWVLKWAALRGHRLILWTCREGDLLKEAQRFLESHGIEFHAINNNLPERIERYCTNPRKVGADLYIDDRAGLIFWPYQFLRILLKELTAR